eukprot:scaffold6565_cov93-Cylindrotheca_fusiformis.AAC.2
MSDSAPRDRPHVATFSFSDLLLGDTSLDPPPPDLTSPAGASLASFLTAQSSKLVTSLYVLAPSAVIRCV